MFQLANNSLSIKTQKKIDTFVIKNTKTHKKQGTEPTQYKILLELLANTFFIVNTSDGWKFASIKPSLTSGILSFV